MKKLWEILRLRMHFLASMAVFLMAWPVFAGTPSGGLGTLAAGTGRLISDLQTWIMWAAPIIAVIALVYCGIRRAMSDEMESKRWWQRILVIIVSTIVILVANGLIGVLRGYYGG
jgi:type IV secretory pathway VirB2 component (pilin)